MASKKPARGAKKTAQAAAAQKPARAAKKAVKKDAKAMGTPKQPRIGNSAAPASEAQRSAPAGTGGPEAGRIQSVQAGLAKLRQRLRILPAKSPLGRNPSDRRTDRDPDKLDAALKRLSESYRDLFK